MLFQHYNLGIFSLVTLYGMFTNHNPLGVATHCLLLELLDVSVSDLLVRVSNQGHSMWLIQHCARDVLEALSFLHREGYVHADLKPRNILWSADDECFKLIDFGLSFKDGLQVRTWYGLPQIYTQTYTTVYKYGVCIIFLWTYLKVVSYVHQVFIYLIKNSWTAILNCISFLWSQSWIFSLLHFSVSCDPCKP